MRWSLSLALLVCCLAAAATAASPDAATPASQQLVAQAFDLSPALFVANQGQWDTRARYGFQGKRLNVFFTNDGPVFSVSGRSGNKDAPLEAASFSVTFAGANKVSPTPLDPSPAIMNYHFGNDPSKWQTGVSTYTKVVYRGLYHGIDLYTWGTRSGLKYEFHVAPGASWRDVVIEYDGIDGLSIDDSGALVAKTSLGQMVDSAPLVYQDTPSGRVAIEARYKLIDSRSYRFDISGPYDPALPIVIDPELAWTQVFGGHGEDSVLDMALDKSGNIWVAGRTDAIDFPTPGGFCHDRGTFDSSFVARVTAAGQLEWATYLGGHDSFPPGGNRQQQQKRTTSIALDASGRVWVVGWTDCPSFPVPGGFKVTLSSYTTNQGKTYYDVDAFVVRLSASGKLEWGSFLGGSCEDVAHGIAVDASGNAYVCGNTISANLSGVGPFSLPYTPGVVSAESPFAAYDGFAAKITPDGKLAWTTCLGGSNYDDLFSVAIDAAGDAWFAGLANSGAPTPGGFATTSSGKEDAYIAHIASSGQLLWASYLGGSGFDVAKCVAIDTKGYVWVAGGTDSGDFPTLGFDVHPIGVGYSFVAKLATQGHLVWANLVDPTEKPREGYYPVSDMAPDACGGMWTVGPIAGDTVNGLPLDYPPESRLGGTLIARVESNGVLGWAAAVGNDVRCDSIVASPAGNVCIGGYMVTWVETPDLALLMFQDAYVARFLPGGCRIITESLPRGHVGVPYSQTLRAIVGVSPASWAVLSGALPVGLALDSATGEIHGVPVEEGTSQFVVKLSDGSNPANTDTRGFSITTTLELEGPLITSVSASPASVRYSVDGEVTLSATADDSTKGDSRVVAAEYFVGAAGAPGTGTAMQPADGSWSASVEEVTAKVDSSAWLERQTYRLSVRAKDEFDHWGSVASVDVPVVDGVAPAAPDDMAVTHNFKFQKILTQGWETAGAPTSQAQEVVIDLGALKVLGGVGLTPAQRLVSFPRQFGVFVSEDGSDWTRVASQSDYKAIAGENLWETEPVSCRYIKLSAVPILDPRDRQYYVKATISVYETVADNQIHATWSATADDGRDPASGAASVYDLRYSRTAVTETAFPYFTCVTGLAQPGLPGSAEGATFSIGRVFGQCNVALKVGDEVPNWSPIAAASATIEPVGFQPAYPDDTAALKPTNAVQFAFCRGLDTKQGVVAFSDRSDFPNRPVRNGDGTVSRTFRWPVTAGVVPYWKAYPSQWAKMKSLSMNSGSLYWRIEGNSPQFARINGPTRALSFVAGSVSDESLSPVHSLAGDDGLWPDPSTAPVFSWVDATVQMKYLFLDVSTDEGFPLSDKARSVVLGGKGAIVSPYTATSAEWLKVRRLAATSGGVLYWRIRAIDADKAFSKSWAVKRVVIDGGAWTVGDVDLKAASPSLSWTHQGQGLTGYSVQFSTSGDFAPATATVTLPAAPVAGSSYTLTAADMAKLASLAQRGSVTTLYYRIMGTDADGAFVAYSASRTAAAP